MELADKVRVYNILREQFECNESYLMAQVGIFLSNHQVKSTDFGYEKMRSLFEEMTECIAVQPVQTGKGMNYTVRLLPWEAASAPASSEIITPALYEPQLEEENSVNLNSKTLSEEEKRKIYELLIEEYPTEVTLPMAAISLTMTNEGFRKETFGFAKMKQLLQELEQFMTLHDTITNGVPATTITLHRVSAWDKAIETVKSSTATEFQKLPDALDSKMLNSKILLILNKLITGEETAPKSDVVEALKESYRNAKSKGTFTLTNNAYTFTVSLTSKNGDPLLAGIKPSSYGDTNGWYMNFVGTRQSRTYDAPGKAIEKFAFMGYWENVLNELAEMAVPEKWYFKGENPESKVMLRGYLQYTFYRLQLEDKVCISDDGQFAAFNTGLVTPRYDDIYACFEPNPDVSKSKWRFIGFSKSGGRGIGKRIVNYFNPLPQPASYFERKEDLLFDLERDLHPDYDHILLDNISRLPIAFLREEMHSETEAQELLDEIEAEHSKAAKRLLYNELREYIGNSDKIYKRLRNRVEDAIDIARKQVRWNFKTALPCFFPTRNVMSLMLPLALVDDGRPDVALVVELTRAGNYQGQTILTLQQAYIDSRLICRPNSEWLNTDDIQIDSEVYSELE